MKKKRILSFITAILVGSANFSFSINALEDMNDKVNAPIAINYNGHSYFVYYNAAESWEEAQEYCQRRGGYLSVINNADENAFLYTYIKSKDIDTAYFGYTDKKNDGNWEWEGDSSSYSNFGEGEPNGGEAENYGAFWNDYPNPGEWCDNAFSERSSFICEWDYENAEPFEYKSYNGHSYSVFDGEATNWYDAKKFCEVSGGYLAVINDVAENSAVFRIMRLFGYESAYFGYTDGDEEGVWQWVNGEKSTYVNWDKSGDEPEDIEPNNGKGFSDENFGMFYYEYPNGTWNDGDFGHYTINSGKAFICEWDYEDSSKLYNENDFTLSCYSEVTKQRRVHTFSEYNSIESMINNYNSEEYHPDMAYLLSILASSAYIENDIKRNLTSLGFNEKDIESFNYYEDIFDERYEKDSCAFSIASKQTNNDETIIMVVIRGSVGGMGTIDIENSDWHSNIFPVSYNILGISTEHQGFAKAEEKIYTQLISEIQKIKTPKIKFVITGHSRGAGVGNLLTKDLIDDGRLKSDIYNYNFACPDSAKDYSTNWNSQGRYNNIFNIAVTGDPVPLVPGLAGNVLTFFSDTIKNTIMPSLNAPVSINNFGKYGNSYWISKNWNQEKKELRLLNHDSVYYVDVLSNMRNSSNLKSWNQAKSFFVPIDGIYINTKVNNNEDSIDMDNTITNVYNNKGIKLATIIGEKVNYLVEDLISISTWKQENEISYVIEGISDAEIEINNIGEGNIDVVISSCTSDTSRTDSAAYYNIENESTGIYISNNSAEKNSINISNIEKTESYESVLYKHSYLYGDINHDDTINSLDMLLLQKHILGCDTTNDIEELGDIHTDGTINILDIIYMKNLILG